MTMALPGSLLDLRTPDGCTWHQLPLTCQRLARRVTDTRCPGPPPVLPGAWAEEAVTSGWHTACTCSLAVLQVHTSEREHHMRFMLGVVVAMGLLGCGGAELDTVEVPESVGSVEKEIVGGSVATAGQAPWQVSLRGSSHFCGGAIYNSRTVITAAHCVDGRTPSQLSIRYNSLNHGFGGTIISVSSIVVHPSYSSATINNDIAVVRLSSPMILGQTQARAIPLPAQGSDPAPGASALISGWGTTSEGGSLPAALRVATVPIVSRATAQSQYGTSSITTNMIAAGLTSGGVDACQADSGGPLVVGGVLAGITSWGIGCARPNYPGIYTRVGNYVTWIQNNAG